MKQYHFLRRIFLALSISIIFTTCKQKEGDGWIELFNGKDLTGWTPNEHPETFRVEDGKLVANGERSHLFYTGDVAGANFKNFELSVDLMTYPRANSGIYILTHMQDQGWPKTGYEIQVNNSHIGAGDFREYKKSGSLYGIRNTFKQSVKDSVWYNTLITVRGNHVTVEIDGRKVVDHIQPDDTLFSHQGGFKTGTFALQGHDPGSKVFYKSIRVKILSDNEPTLPVALSFNDTQRKMMRLQSHQMTFTDLDVIVDSSLQVEQAIDFFYKTGINLGFVFDSKTAARRSAFASYPVFLGLKAESIKDVNPSDYDFVIGAVSPDFEKTTSGKDAFMKLYVDKALALLNSKTVDVWASPTLLPKSLMPDYEKLWTKERMSAVIDAAKQNNVAIEINNALKVPGHAFIKMARAKGCLFTYGGIDRVEMGNLDYIFQVIEQDSLDYREIYAPGAPWQRK